MDIIVIAIIAVLCQYPLAILSLIKLFRIGLSKKPMLIWNVFIVAVPFVGVISFWIYYLARTSKADTKNNVSASKEINSDTQSQDNCDNN